MNLNQGRTEVGGAKTPGRAGSDLPAPAISYVVGIIGIGLAAAAWALVTHPPQNIQNIILWALAALAGEMLLFATATGRAQVNLATSVHLAMILALPTGDMVVALLASRFVAKFILKRQVWYRALFNVAQGTGATLAAAGVLSLVSGTSGVASSAQQLLDLAPGFLAAGVVYYVLNTFSVAGVVAYSTNGSVFRTWRENYGYLAEASGTVALILFSPLMYLAWQMLGWPGLLVFLAPSLFVKIMSERYVDLRNTQQDAIASERLAAKGEMAAEVGHEINNYLTAVYCHMQMLAVGDRKGDDGMDRVKEVLAQLDNISSLSKGLMDFSHRETRRAPVKIADLIEGTLAFLRPQNRFEGTEIRLDLDPRVGEVNVDAAQIQQVVTNLVLNAANVMNESGRTRRQMDIWLRLHDITGVVEFGVADNGPGIPAELRRRIFEPGFTTRANGNGFGLSTSLRIVQNHGGELTAENLPTGGALFRVTLPLGPRSARKAA